MKLTKVKLTQIKPYWRNPRNNAPAVEAVKRSIQEYGYNSPILVDKSLVVIAGHTRLTALRDLGYEDVQVGILDLTEEQAKAYRIADNKSSELATWDEEKLLQELREITNIESLDVFFPTVDLSEMVAESVGAESFSYPTQDKIEEESDRAATQFDGTNENYKQGLFEVFCPHCGKPHFINKAEASRMLPDV